MKKKTTLFIIFFISITLTSFGQEYNEITLQLNKSGASPQGNSNGWVFSNLTFNLEIVQNQLGPDTYRTHGKLTDSYTVEGYRYNGKLYKLGEKPFVNHESFSGYKKLRITLADGGSISNFEKTGGGFTIFDIDAGYKTLKNLSKIKFQNIEILEFTDNHMEYVLNNYLKSEKQNEPTQISNTGDGFSNSSLSNNNSNSQIQPYSQTNNNYNTNTSGLTKEQIKAQENFKQNQQEQMQYVQNKIAENRQNAQNLQKAADETEEEWQKGNYIQGSTSLAQEYINQGNEEAAIGTLAVGVGLDVVSSIQANREKRKAEEAQIRKIEDAKKIAFEKEKVRREKFVESHENTILKLIKDGTSIFDISTKTEKIELYGRILDYDVASFQLAKENHQFDYFYITFVQAVQYDGKGYDNYTPGAYLFHSNIKPKSILYYSNPIKFPMEFIKNKNDLGVFLMNLDNLHPAAKYNGSELDRNILYFHTSENTFNNLINQKNTFYNNLNIFFEKKTTSQVYENFAKNYGEIRTELNNIESNIETIDTGEIYKLANAYYKGQGVNKDLKRAEDLYTQAAENGNVEAMVGLGHLYVVNITPLERQLYGVPWDAVKSFYWYEKAAEAGHVESMVIVGNYTYAGKGTPKDFSKAVIWYNKAIEKGSLEAMYELGDRYFYKSDEKAFFYWQQAAEKEHLPSIKRLGEMYSNLTIQYFKGDSKKLVKKHKNIEKAFFWYKKACDLGDNNSCETLKYLKI